MHHEEGLRATLLAARQRAAATRAARAQNPAPTPFRLESAEDVRRVLEETAAKVLEGRLSASAGTVIGSLCRAALVALETALLEKLEGEKAQQEAARPVSFRRRG
jgi:hypothetical protein